MVTVLIGGDIAPIGKSLRYFREGDVVRIFDDLLIEFEKADLSIINLECPLIDVSTPIVKNGPNLGVESDCVNGIKQAKIDVVNLANNHILDHGSIGLKNTLDVCAKNSILTVGAGKNRGEARKMLIREIDKIRIGILSLAQHEFSIGADNSWGANPLDLIDYVRNVRSQRNNFDYLIVLLHAGSTYYPFPSPQLKDTCQFMVEMGANAVIVQHGHCAGCYDKYQNAYIVYNQGDLVFDWPHPDKDYYKGVLVKLEVTEDLSSEISLIPYLQPVPEVGVRKMKKEEEHVFLQRFEERSLAIKDDAFVNAQWVKYCDKRKFEYLSNVLGHNRLFSRLNKNGLILKYFYTTKSLMHLQNVVCCESHREILETVLNQKMI